MRTRLCDVMATMKVHRSTTMIAVSPWLIIIIPATGGATVRLTAWAN